MCYLASANENLELFGQIPPGQRAVDCDLHEAALEGSERVLDTFIQHEISVKFDKLFSSLERDRDLVAVFFEIEVGDRLERVGQADLKSQHERLLELFFGSLELEN